LKRLAGAPFQIQYTNSARKEFLQLTKADALRMRTAIDGLAFSGVGDFRALEGYPNVVRLRVGSMRAEFIVLKTKGTLTVIRVFYQQDGYRTKGRSRR
jgi:mRNA-degrading endonuclease RelE of RelBE toxin-antitoxin system